MRYLKITLACSALLLGVGLMGATTVQAAPTPPTTMAHKTTKKVKKAKKTKKVKKAKKLSAKAKRQKAKKKAFTKAERAQIAGYRSQAKQISNATKGMYVQKPSLKKSFNPGKLSAKYINGTVGWVNFYRQMFGLAPVKADAGWNTDAQYGAATLAAADMGLSHGLEGIQRPSFISPADWQRGADATNNSNIGWGDVNPAGNVVGYLNEADDEGDLVPGHREWLLGGISRVGVGQAQAYNDLRVIEDGWTHPEPQTVAYPRAGVMPVALVNHGAPWSVSYADDCGENAPKPQVSVYDQTAHKAVSLSQIGISNSNYGWFGTTVYFLPRASQVKVNHTYTVAISHIANQADVHYTTKLFNLKA